MKTSFFFRLILQHRLIYIAVSILFFMSISYVSKAQSTKNSSFYISDINSSVKNSAAIPNLLRIKATTALSSDETVVYFRDDATEGFDPEFDAYKLTGGADAPQLGSVTIDSIKLCINALPCVVCGRTIPLYFSLNQVTPVTFTATGFESFTMNEPIFLEDLQENKLINLKENPIYTFTYQPAETDRFQLIFLNYVATSDEVSDKAVVYYFNGNLHIDIPSVNGKKADIQTFDIAGRLMKSTTTILNGQVRVDAPKTPGIYIIRILAANKLFTQRIIVG